MERIKNVDKYEWLVFLFDGIILIFVGLFLLGTIIKNSSGDRTLPTMIASLACIVMSLYFFAEALFTKSRKRFRLEV
jgi:hypothetical protein